MYLIGDNQTVMLTVGYTNNWTAMANTKIKLCFIEK